MERPSNIDPVRNNSACKACGFRPGDQVVMGKMTLAAPDRPVKELYNLHGRIEDFVAPGRHSTRCHVVRWQETKLLTVLPSPDVKLAP